MAVDVSVSVDQREYRLQAEGIAAAFRDPSVRDAIDWAGPRSIAVAIVQWAGGRKPVVAIDWTHLRNDRSLTTFAARIASMPRLFIGSDTWLGQAIGFGVGELLGNKIRASRQVIDLSGDGGSETIGLTRQARDAAIATGVVINGLAIVNEDPELHRFFRDNLIGGVGAFVMQAASYDDFAEVMRRKLLREISERPIATVDP